MKVAQAAKILGLSNEGVMYHIYKGHLIATEVVHSCPGKRRYDISAEDIAAYKLKKQREKE